MAVLLFVKMNREGFVADYLRPPEREGEKEREGEGENEREGEEEGRDGENVGRDGEIDGREVVVDGREVVVDGRVVVVVDGRAGWDGATEGRDGVVFAGRVSKLCAGRVGEVVACVSGDTGRVTARPSVGFVRTTGCASPVFGRAGRASVWTDELATRRAAIALVRACGVVLRWAKATARASGLARRSGTAPWGTLASATLGDAGRYARVLCPGKPDPDEPTEGRAGR
jgi:hypothetical protein